ncbi:M48 family metalloprotease [Sphingomonas sp.]|jgi:predicted Zn-dependent protease|uniref:M48 family metalloprotease n=1 Tax=Sphingomonas sp. TaxID=28214 RepID=UPI002DE42FC1|nr:M48 family metalloprotease [Sphingomonas sp.]HEV2569640.1 M48 family metalloprotease [Sphingomonas sp.]
MRHLLRTLFALLISFAVLTRPVTAQSILRDAETEALLADMSKPLIEAAGLQPKNVEIVMIADNSINAFVAGGQIVYIHSGLITQAENANMVQGVIAHELGHVTGGHIVRMAEGMKTATGIMLLSLLLGAAAMAAGAGEAGAGLLSMGQQAALGKFLAFSRVQESSADAAGVTYLNKAGVSGQGLVAFFKKLQNQEYRYGYNSKDAYDRTHPLSRERVTTLVDALQSAPSWNAKSDPAIEARFARVKAKLKGYVLDPPLVMQQYPETDQTVPARYARAYAWHRGAYPEKAMQEVDALLRTAPRDPYFLELKGQVLLESGKPKEALPALREAVQLTGYNPLITSMFGHALIATEDRANFAEAEQVLRSAIAKDNQNPFAWYQLGVVYDRKGDAARAALATAERYNLQGNPQLAFANARVAMAGIPRGSADWVRAQDIFMVSEPEIKKRKKNREEPQQ